MVKRRTEYQTRYRPEPGRLTPALTARSYLEALRYREGRRSVEHRHVPLAWDDDQLLLSAREGWSTQPNVDKGSFLSDDDSDSGQGGSLGDLRENQFRHPRRHNGGTRYSRDRDEGRRIAGLVERSMQTPDHRVRDTAVQTRAAETQQPSANKVARRPVEGVGVVVRPRVERHIPRSDGAPAKSIRRVQSVRSAAAAAAAPPPTAAALATRPPFLSYGAGDRQLAVGLRTYNVRAENNVYQSAKLAQKKHEAERRERHQKALTSGVGYPTGSLPTRRPGHTAAGAAVYLPDRQFQEKLAQETQKWRSEYATNFREIDSNVYRQNLGSRLHAARQKPAWLAYYV